MVNKTLLSLAIAISTAGLTACNLSSTADSEAVATDPILAGQAGQVPSTVTPLFNPARAQLPLATDFLFGFPKEADGSTKFPEDADGTLYHAGAYAYAADGNTRALIAPGEAGYNPIQNALNEMDGVSINAEIDIPLSGDIDAATIIPGKNVILVPLNYDDPITGDLVAGESPFKTEFSDFTVSKVKYATPEGAASKYALRVNLTKPLASKTRYLVIIANDGADAITDVAGKAIEMPNQYRALAGDGILLSAALAPVRDLVQNWTALAKGYLGAKQQDTEGLVMAYTLTTGGGIEVLSTMAAPGNANPLLQQNPALRAVVATAFANNPGNPSAGQDEAVATLMAAPYNVPAESVAAVIGLATSLQTPGPRAVSLPAVAGSGGLDIDSFSTSLTTSAKVLTGTIDLPYYLEAPMGAYTGQDPTAITGYLCTPANPSDPADPCNQVKQSAGNTIVSQWSADDGLLPILGASPPSTNVTRLYPFAKKNGMRKAPLLVVKPTAAASTFGHSDGYPVVIYQHGIFGNRTNSLAVANTMASAGFVTVAMDLPLHGVMPTDLVGENPMLALLLGAQDIAADATTIGGATVGERHFGLTNVANGFSPTAVSGTDASLNGSGSLFFNLIHLQTARDNSRQAVMDLLNLNASLEFIDLDNDVNTTDIDETQVHYIGHSLGGIIGTVFVATNNLNGSLNTNGNAALPVITETVLGMPGSAIPRLLEASAAFGPAIKGPVTTPQDLGGFGLTENSESYNQLFYIFQGSLDSADPASFAQAMSMIPGSLAKYMVIESIGDQVVPNSATSPLAGTEPLAALLGTTQIDTGTSDYASGKFFVKFNDDDSSHGSLATPGSTGAEIGAFTEIMTLTINLFTGANPVVTSPTVAPTSE
jgi:hypothetical protein